MVENICTKDFILKSEWKVEQMEQSIMEQKVKEDKEREAKRGILHREVPVYLYTPHCSQWVVYKTDSWQI